MVFQTSFGLFEDSAFENKSRLVFLIFDLSFRRLSLYEVHNGSLLSQCALVHRVWHSRCNCWMSSSFIQGAAGWVTLVRLSGAWRLIISVMREFSISTWAFGSSVWYTKLRRRASKSLANAYMSRLRSTQMNLYLAINRVTLTFTHVYFSPQDLSASTLEAGE